MSGEAVIGFVRWGKIRVAILAPNLRDRLAMSSVNMTTKEGYLELLAVIVSRCVADPKTLERPFADSDRDVLLNEIRSSYPDRPTWMASTRIADMVGEHCARTSRAAR